MPTEPTVLDYRKFNLDAFKTTAEVNMKMMQAYADYNYRMMEVVELQTKVATDRVKLAILQESFDNYRLAQREARRRVKEAEKKAKQISKAIRDLNHLLFGETASASFVPLGWQGFRFLTSQADTSILWKLSQVDCESGDRLGTCFFNANRPDEEVPDAPVHITKALGLMDWARRSNFVPRLGSGAQDRLGELLTILGSGAVSALSSCLAALKDAERELARIRETSWDNLDVKEEKPKSSK